MRFLKRAFGFYDVVERTRLESLDRLALIAMGRENNHRVT